MIPHTPEFDDGFGDAIEFNPVYDLAQKILEMKAYDDAIVYIEKNWESLGWDVDLKEAIFELLAVEKGSIHDEVLQQYHHIAVPDDGAED